MENGGDDHEEPEEEQLHAETADDDPFAPLDVIIGVCVCKHAAAWGEKSQHPSTTKFPRIRSRRLTSTLSKKGNDVAQHEDLGQPIYSNGRVRRSVRKADDAAENHVDGSSEEGRCQEKSQALHDVRPRLPVGRLPAGDEATEISNRFDCSDISANLIHSCGARVQSLTDATDDEWDEVPSPSSQKLPEVEHCRVGEQSDEDDSQGCRRAVVVEHEAVF